MSDSNNLSAAIPDQIIGRALEVLREEATVVRTCITDVSADIGSVGETVQFPRAQVLTAGTHTPTMQPANPAAVALGDETVVLDEWVKTEFGITTRQMSAMGQRGVEVIARQLDEAARGVAYRLNAKCIGLYKSIYGFAGTAGTNPFATNVDPAADVREVLNRQLCPNGARRLTLGYKAETAALKLDDFKKALNRGDTGALHRGELGDLFGMRVQADGQIPIHTTGAATGYQVNNVAGYAAGSTSLAIDTGSGAWVEGDIVSFAGHSQTYAVDAGSTTTLLVLKNPLGAAVANDEAITKRASHEVNLAADPGWAGLALRLTGDQMALEGLNASTLGIHRSMTDSKTGLPLKLSILPGDEMWLVRLSVIAGAGLLDARRAARLAGAVS